MTHRFIDAPYDQRCAWTITLRDGSTAQCGRHKTKGQFCTQHARMALRVDPKIEADDERALREQIQRQGPL